MVTVDLRVDTDAWNIIDGLETVCINALNAAAQTMRPAQKACTVDVLLTDDDALASLNKAWRGKEGPTDVLSFPSEDTFGTFLGDIAIAFGVTERDAQTSDTPLTAHLSHLLIHGLLHLGGYDHMAERDAEIMESHERTALATLGYADPYSRIVEN